MTLKQSIQRLKWRFSEKKPFAANENDFEALNTIIDFCASIQKKNYQEQELFAKLYIAYYSNLLKFYDCTVFDSMPKKHIDGILSKPLFLLIEELKEQLNLSEKYLPIELSGKGPLDHIHIAHIKAAYNRLGYSDEDIDIKVKKIVDDRKKSNKDLAQLLEEHEELRNLLLTNTEVWNHQKVADSVETMINGSINDYLISKVPA
ncbi:hypothetical protein DX873_14730 [Flagellimonas nanhaiensis]|uniref:Uncharacterized protein n=2 Tax=Flagellimonas nanhaiensis TaxID=2292706 RepID=A0A371JNT8_9FLAO|nr:hypothetical protein DX873_14730 [Allomuricauda nanhaiensis]